MTKIAVLRVLTRIFPYAIILMTDNYLENILAKGQVEFFFRRYCDIGNNNKVSSDNNGNNNKLGNDKSSNNSRNNILEMK